MNTILPNYSTCHTVRVSEEPSSPHPARIAVVGLGYVGCVTSACLARLGHQVTGLDRDEFKVASVLDGRAPFFEPGLEEAIQQSVSSGHLTATASAEEALTNAQIALLCVGTPSNQYGNISLEQMDRVCAEIARHQSGRAEPLIAAIRSTVFPGTCEEMYAKHFERLGNVSIVSNPEFLREGTAMRDFVEPSLIVVGGGGEPAGKVASIYDGLGMAASLVSLRTAEMIKYACNAFHAVKISFANEIGSLASVLGVDPAEVMQTLCQDTRLNISTAYMKPGFAFGGSCLPKDLRALNYRAKRMHQDLPMLASVLESNQKHLARAIDAVLALPTTRLSIFGLAFKEQTDDLRESPVVALIEQLVGKGREVRIYDPQIQLDAIYGSNRGFLFAAVPHIEHLMVGSIEELLEWSGHVVIAQKPSPAMNQRLHQSGRQLLDLVSPQLPYQQVPVEVHV